MNSEWSHLPNARHIDRVLASLKANPEAWDATRSATRSAAWTAARSAAWTAARSAARSAAWHAARSAAGGTAWDATWDAAWDAARDATRDATRNAAWGVIAALVVWDNCAHLLDSEPEEVRLLAALGVNAAILLYPASLVFSKEKELYVESTR